MSIRKTVFVLGEFYHVYNRGNSKQDIFNDKADYMHFLKLLCFLNTQNPQSLRYLSEDFLIPIYKGKNKLVSIGCYCLMPNHFHLILTQKEGGSISKFMQKVNTAYVMYYNKKYKRTGSLFEGKFKSNYANDDIYLKYLFSYVHLNPIKLIQKNWKKEGIKDKNKALIFLKNYKYSSYSDYLGTGHKSLPIIEKEFFPNYFSTGKNFESEILEWISYGTA